AAQVRDRLPGMQWVQAGADHWVSDVGALLNQAQIVITHCGQNAIADIAAIDVPAVLQPQPRPHGEQVSLGAELARLSFGVSVPAPEGAAEGAGTDWASLVHTTMAAPSRWQQWGTESSASRAVELIEQVAHG
ncbi:MAG: glycosyltransferase, partial [Ornithinimicrobium sp.]